MTIEMLGWGTAAFGSLFLGYIATRKGHFRYERTESIKAPIQEIFAVLSNLKTSAQWTTFEKLDPRLQKYFVGEDGALDSSLTFEGNREAGAGKIKIIDLAPPTRIKFLVTTTAPLKTETTIEYILAAEPALGPEPQPQTTHCTCILSGDGGYLLKFITFFVDYEKLLTERYPLPFADAPPQ